MSKMKDLDLWGPIDKSIPNPNRIEYKTKIHQLAKRKRAKE